MELISTSLVLHFLVLLILFAPKISAQFSFRNHQCSDTTYAPNSTYQSNLKHVLNALSSDTRVTYGFYNFSAGQQPNRVEATALCRGDLPVATCRDCVRNSAALLPSSCLHRKGAFGFSDECVMFFYNSSIFHRPILNPHCSITFNLSLSDTPGVNRTLDGLLETLQNKAALGDSQLKFATGNVNITANQTLYGLVQCNPDLSRRNCVECVQGIMRDFPIGVTTPTFIAGGARTVGPACNVRYELYRFFGNVTHSAPSPAPAPLSNRNTTIAQGKKSETAFIIIPIVGSAILLFIAAFICLFWRKKKLRKNHEKFDKEEIETLKSLQFSLGTIKVATEDFSDRNKLGHGGFGVVYKGTLPDGQQVAVKRLLKNSSQGDVQFKNEILTLAKLQHRNLVRLQGFCFEGEEVILIYEFMTNKSLDTFLHDPVQRASLSWETRYKLINGIAKGLLYLHEDSRLRIIHRDLKAGNVLLDAEFNPKIADFGMARLFNMDQTRAVTNKIVGTYGYMPPEYVLHGNISMKLDVFSFGVLVLEIVNGHTIGTFRIDENPENLLSFAWKNWQQGTPWNIVDPALTAASRPEIRRCIHIGLLCVQHIPAERPTMSSVAMMLSTSSMSLQMPSQPAFFTRVDTSDRHDSPTNKMYSVNEVSITEPYPR